MSNWLRRYTKGKLVSLRNWDEKSSEERNNIIKANSISAELPFLALLNLLDIFKGFFDSFTRYKSIKHLARDQDQLINGLKNVGWGFYYLAVLIPLSINSSFNSITKHLVKGNDKAAMQAFGQMIAIPLGILLNSIASVARGLIQIIASPLNYIACVFRFLITYKILKKEKDFQENSGTIRLVDKGLEILKNNGPGSQKAMLNIFEAINRKLEKANNRSQPVSGQPINFKEKAEAIGLNKDERNLGDLRLDKAQFDQAKELLKWLHPQSKAMLDIEYTVSRSFNH